MYNIIKDDIRWSNIIILFLLLAISITFTNVMILSINKYVIRQHDLQVTDRELALFWIYFIIIATFGVLFILYNAEKYINHIKNVRISPVSAGVGLPSLVR